MPLAPGDCAEFLEPRSRRQARLLAWRQFVPGQTGRVRYLGRNRQRHPAVLAENERADGVVMCMPSPLTDQQRQAIEEAILSEQKIQAIKLYREATSAGLA